MKRAKIKRKDYDDIYDCIVTDQMSAANIAYYFSDLKFLSWFKRKRK
tara:strand:- start:2222 stop:2362 length:141 start_codon:yes stop_codon:yes gene_type:complete